MLRIPDTALASPVLLHMEAVMQFLTEHPVSVCNTQEGILSCHIRQESRTQILHQPELPHSGLWLPT